ncbi:hypothetical protein [Methanobrevibacter sp.]
MRFKVVLVSLILLAFFIGAVSAADITNYNSPIGFERDPMTFVNGDFEMEMDSYNAFIDYDDHFKSEDDRQVEIINDTYAKYFDSDDKKAGALEIIKVDGDQYIVDSSFSGDDKSKSEDCLKYLEEFNQLNKFKPIKIDKAS